MTRVVTLVCVLTVDGIVGGRRQNRSGLVGWAHTAMESRSTRAC